jgi:hypothetical protein
MHDRWEIQYNLCSITMKISVFICDFQGSK